MITEKATHDEDLPHIFDPKAGALMCSRCGRTARHELHGEAAREVASAGDCGMLPRELGS